MTTKTEKVNAKDVALQLMQNAAEAHFNNSGHEDMIRFNHGAATCILLMEVLEKLEALNLTIASAMPRLLPHSPNAIEGQRRDGVFGCYCNECDKTVACDIAMMGAHYCPKHRTKKLKDAE
jgi:hypothetical protein